MVAQVGSRGILVEQLVEGDVVPGVSVVTGGPPRRPRVGRSSGADPGSPRPGVSAGHPGMFTWQRPWGQPGFDGKAGQRRRGARAWWTTSPFPARLMDRRGRIRVVNSELSARALQCQLQPAGGNPDGGRTNAGSPTPSPVRQLLAHPYCPADPSQVAHSTAGAGFRQHVGQSIEPRDWGRVVAGLIGAKGFVPVNKVIQSGRASSVERTLREVHHQGSPGLERGFYLERQRRVRQRHFIGIFQRHFASRLLPPRFS